MEIKNPKEILDEVEKELIKLSFKLKDGTEERYILNRCIREFADLRRKNKRYEHFLENVEDHQHN